jgi:hypothetical protein
VAWKLKASEWRWVGVGSGSVDFNLKRALTGKLLPLSRNCVALGGLPPGSPRFKKSKHQHKEIQGMVSQFMCWFDRKEETKELRVETRALLKS